MLAFDPLGLPFPRLVALRSQLPRIRAPVISVKAFDPKRFQELLQLLQHCILAPAKDICQDCAAVMIDGVPEPPRFFLLAHLRPHFVDLRRFNSANSHFHVVGLPPLQEPSVD